MKVNLSKAFKDYKGDEATEDVEVLDKDGKKTTEKKVQTMSNLLGYLLFNGHGLIRSGDASKDNARKYEAYKLSVRVVASKGAIDLTPEEAVIIKEVASNLPAGGYGQVVDLIDGKEA